MDQKLLKEYIRSLIYEVINTSKEIDEDGEGMSTSDNAGAYSTKYAFKKKEDNVGKYSGVHINTSGEKVGKCRKCGKTADLGSHSCKDIDDELDERRVTGAVNLKGGRRYVPDETILPSSLLPGNFKILANGNNIFLLISPLAKVALEAITRGRTNIDTQANLPRLARLFADKMPQMTRGLIKSGIKTSKINRIAGGEWIPVEVEIKGIDPDTKDIHLRIPKPASMSVTKPGEEPAPKQPNIQNDLYEQISKMIENELLKESTYSQFKNDVKYRSKSEQLHKAFTDINRRLNEIDRLMEYTIRMKQELSEGEEGVKYWKRSKNTTARINERLQELSNKIKELYQ